jgi:cation:H+ antiporter
MLFALSLAVTLAAGEALVRGLDRLGGRLGFSGAMLGLLTALGAAAPEISSALAPLRAGARDIGLGVVLGSNIFNLAALLGLGAVLAGRVHVRRAGLVLHGGVALWATLVSGTLLRRALAPAPASVLLAVVVIPYVVGAGAHGWAPGWWRRRWRWPERGTSRRAWSVRLPWPASRACRTPTRRRA